VKVVQTIPELRAARAALAGDVGVVPTMGYLHAGHLALVEASRAENAHTIATIFVNPTQFAANEDLSAYPRDLPRDLALLEAAGVEVVFTPPPDSMYPPDFQTYINVERVSLEREGGSRPGHFRGVATIVAKLFNLVQAQRAYFGQKDAQQVAVIRQMVRDLNFPLDIVVCPIVREPDGLAMSSRNVYLTPEQRQAAAVLYRALQAVGAAYEQGERQPVILRQIVTEVLGGEPLAQLDYVSLAEAGSFREIDAPTSAPLLLSIAAQVGKPRLLDNCLLPLHLNTRAGATSTLGVGENLHKIYVPPTQF
jgi:pantoate--beta-alanine ligase